MYTITPIYFQNEVTNLKNHNKNKIINMKNILQNETEKPNLHVPQNPQQIPRLAVWI